METDDLPPPPIPKPAPLNYRPPVKNPTSQWWTDEHAYGAALIFGLLGLMFLGTIVGAVWWLISSFF